MIGSLPVVSRLPHILSCKASDGLLQKMDISLSCPPFSKFHQSLSLSMNEHPHGLQTNFNSNIGRKAFLKFALASSVFAILSQGRQDASAEPYLYVNYLKNGTLTPVFQLDVPKEYFKSKRPLDYGTIFVAGSLSTAEIVSVQIISMAQLLTDIGAVPTGDLSSWPAIGNSLVVADLLSSARDGDSKRLGGQPSKIDPASVTVRGNTLTFLTVTPMVVKQPEMLRDPAVAASVGATADGALRRLTCARAEIRPDGTAVVLWAGALEREWQAGAGARLQAVADSLRLVAPDATLVAPPKADPSTP